MLLSLSLLCYISLAQWGKATDTRKVDMPVMPLFPDNFVTTMSISNGKMEFRFFTTFGVDSERQRIAMRLHHPFDVGVFADYEHLFLLIDFKNGYISVVDETNDLCRTETLSHDSGLWKAMTSLNPWLHLYGMKIDEKRMSTAEEIRQFLETVHGTKIIKETINGVRCNQWSFNFLLQNLDLTYLGDNDVRVILDFSWSERGEWHTGWGWPGASHFNDTFPVLTTFFMYPQSKDTHMPNYQVYIDYAYVAPNPHQEDFFQVPGNVLCYGEPVQSLPDWGKFYAFDSEIAIPPDMTLLHSSDKGHLFYTKNYFDVEHSLSPLVYKHVDLTVSNSTTIEYNEIHDFKTKMLYRWSTAGGKCIVEPLIVGDIFLDDLWDIARYHLWQEIDFFNRNITTHRAGEIVVRGVYADTYVQERKDWPHFVTNAETTFNITTLWQWYICKDNWLADEILDTEKRVPLRLDLNIHSVDKHNLTDRRDGVITYNLFNFHPHQQFISHAFRVTQCLGHEYPRDILSLQLDNHCDSAVASLNEEQLVGFTNDVHEIIVRLAGLESLLRVQIDSVRADNKSSIVFSVLKEWSLPGSVISPLRNVDAIANLSASIGDYELPLASPYMACRVVTVKRVSQSVSSLSSSNARVQYSPGTLTTVALLMLLVGAGLGVGGVLAYANRYRLSCGGGEDLVALVT